MKKFRIRNGVAAIIIISMVIVAGCGKGASSTDHVKPDKDTTAVEENDTKEDIQAEVPENGDAAEQEDDSTGEGEDVSSSSEMNEYGIPADLMQELYDCVEEAVLTGYIEPNGIAPAEFEWPGDDLETHVFAWSYLSDCYKSYLDTGAMYDSTNLSFEKPEESVCKIMDAVFDGMVEWSSNVSEDLYKINMMHSPIFELFPENIDFTD